MLIKSVRYWHLSSHRRRKAFLLAFIVLVSDKNKHFVYSHRRFDFRNCFVYEWKMKIMEKLSICQKLFTWNLFHVFRDFTFDFIHTPVSLQCACTCFSAKTFPFTDKPNIDQTRQDRNNRKEFVLLVFLSHVNLPIGKRKRNTSKFLFTWLKYCLPRAFTSLDVFIDTNSFVQMFAERNRMDNTPVQ